MAQSLPSLVLLPPPPSPATPAALSAAYRPSITSVVSSLKGLEASTELLVVLPCPSLYGRLHLPRSEIYSEVQELLGGVYSLICVVCAHLGADVDSDTPGSIDARILLLDYTSSQTFPAGYDSTLDPFVSGPIIDLPTLSITRRRWNLIFSVDGEEGQKVLSAYTDLANRISPPLLGNVKTVDGGISLVQRAPPKPAPHPHTSTPHNIVIVGGTFDHIHAGHKLLLSAMALLLQPASRTSSEPRRLIVGVTGDELLKNKKYAEYVGSWDQRQQDVVNFLVSILSFARPGQEIVETLRYDEPGPNGRAVHTKLKSGFVTIECVEIQDSFGPTITDESITALVVSGETRSGGQAVNDKRAEKGWHALEVFEVDVLDAEEHGDGPSKTSDFASKISSTAIRKRKAERARTSSL